LGNDGLGNDSAGRAGGLKEAGAEEDSCDRADFSCYHHTFMLSSVFVFHDEAISAYFLDLNSGAAPPIGGGKQPAANQ
jgi:hypothetical protein